MRIVARLALLVLGGAALLGGVAEAHANYVRSTPASDARLAPGRSAAHDGASAGVVREPRISIAP